MGEGKRLGETLNGIASVKVSVPTSPLLYAFSSPLFKSGVSERMLSDDPLSPKLLWIKTGFNHAYQVAFYEECKYIAVVDMNNNKVKIYTINGELYKTIELKP